MKKKTALLLLCILVLVCSLSLRANAATSGDWEYTVSGASATVTAYRGTSKNVTVPGILGGYDVVAIGRSAFQNNTAITSVSFPEGLSVIESYAFEGCTGLSSITIPTNVVSIQYHAFYNCTGLSSITFNARKLDGCDSYGNTFYNAGKNSGGIAVTFGPGVTRIPDHLFSCDEGYYARVKSVSIGTDVTEIGDSAFQNCRDLSSIHWGSNVQTVGGSAFQGCTSLTTVALPSGVTDIGHYAFEDCIKLSSLTIPEGTVSIGYHAFYNCTGLSNITINARKMSGCDSYGNTFYNAGKNSGGISVTFGNQVTRIPDHLFSCDEGYYARVTKVTMGSGITEIGGSAFRNCGDLSSIHWGSSVQTVGGSAFQGCTALTAVSFPGSVTDIGYYAFEDCIKLSSLTIPEGTVSIGYHAFYNCTGLSDITINARMMNGCDSYGNTFYNAGKNSGGIAVTFGNQVTRIPDHLFSCDEGYYARVKSVSLGSGVTEIGDSAFRNCADLSSIRISRNVERIGWNAFSGCDRLTIYGYRGTAAESYATENSIPFIPLDGENPFVDVAEGRFYYKPVIWAVKSGITSGVDSTHFMPDATCTRGQVVTFLWRACGSPEPETSRCPFTDVSANRFYYKAVLWAYENGITAGIDATHFRPDDTVTRGQFVTFLWRAEGKPAPGGSNPFVDVKQGTFCYNAVLWASANGITSGMDATHFGTNRSCTRGQVVTFLYRCFG